MARRLALTLVFSLAVSAAAQVDKHAIDVPGWPSGGMPLSPGITSRDMVLASGMAGFNLTSHGLVPGGIGPETKQALTLIQQIMEAGGIGMASVTGCAVYLQDIKDFAAMNEVYATFFPKPRPTRVAMQVAALAGGASVEIECFAAKASVSREAITVPGWPDMSDVFPFSVGLKVEDFVYVSGVVGINMHTGKMAQGGAFEETMQALSNVKAIMEAGTTTMGNVVKCALYLKDATDFGQVSEAWAKFFSAAAPPMGLAMQVVSLAGAASVEIQCFGTLPGVRREQVAVPGFPKTPFSSWGVDAAGFVHVTGLPGIDFATGKFVPGGIGPETTQSLSLIKQVVEAAGSSMADVVECAVYLSDLKDFAAMNEAYVKFFPAPPPVRVAMQPGALILGQTCLGRGVQPRAPAHGQEAVLIQCSASSPSGREDQIVI